MNPQTVFRKLDIQAAYRDLIPSIKFNDDGEGKGRCPLCTSTITISQNFFTCSKCGTGNIFGLYALLKIPQKTENHITGLDEAVNFYDTYTKVHKTSTILAESPILKELSEVIAERVQWLWNSYIPLGKITLLDGDPGLGKSLISTDLAARISSNRKMPDGTKGLSGGVVLMALEDGLADTIVPRIEAAGGNKSRIIAFEGVKNAQGTERLPTVEDINHIEQACKKVKAKLVIIDPLMGMLSGKKDSYRDQDMRRALTPLAKMADKLKFAVLVIRHLNKSGGTQSIYRGGGSIGIIGLARAGYLVARDPADNNRRIMACTKMNLGIMPSSLSFSIEEHRESSGHHYQSGVPKILWHEVSEHTADGLLTPPKEKKETVLGAAQEFLKDVLKDGPMDAKEIFKLSDDLGFAHSNRTLMTAKKELNIKSTKRKDGWVWKLPDKSAKG